DGKLRTISGVVKDEATNETLPGITVSVMATGKTVITDKDGKFKIDVGGENPVLIIKSIGFTSQSVSVKGRNNLEVKLKQQLVSLNEVNVTVGYGTQKRKEVTGAVGSVSGDQLETHPMGDINTSLQGKIAGLQITSNSGEPGAGATVRIRGASSVNGSSQPLYIVDGVPINTETFAGGLNDDGSTFSPLADINPADIESIDFLKDGTASIYGSRASNGVILITTRSGRNSKKPTLRFSSNTSIAELSRTVGVMNGPQWRSAYIDAIFNSTGQMTTKPSVIDSLNPNFSKSIDWHDIMYRQAIQQKTDISISGGSISGSAGKYTANVSSPGTTARIQRGILAADTGFTVNLATGAFTENVVVNKRVTLQGNGKDSTKINAATATGNIISIAADSIALKDMYLEGSPDSVTHLSATRGIYINSNLKNLVITNIKASGHQYGVLADNGATVSGIA
ncbi:MAG: hypothetical protein EOO92_23960, partial [Pedobacter sp.]